MDSVQKEWGNSSKVNIGNSTARTHQIDYWSQFFFNNKEYMERSLKAVSGKNIDHVVALKFAGKDFDVGIVNSQRWVKEWELILNGELEDLPASWVQKEKKFSTFIEQFIKLAFTKLKALYIYKNPYISLEDGFLQDLLDHIADKLHSLCNKTLVLELNVCREKGILKGTTPEERYHYFENEVLVDRNFLSSFGNEYKCLIALLIGTVNSLVDFIENILRHLEEDWRDLTEISPNLGRVKKLHLGQGDTHNCGKSVSILEFDSGQKLVYKPRSLEVDQLYQKLIFWMNQQQKKIPIIYRTKVISKENHGWSEFIPYRACQSVKEVKEFYKRMGAQLALLYVLNATDFHYGNIIAMGEHPVFIDMESLFHQNIYEDIYKEDALGRAEQMLSKSIMASGMLPNLLYQRNDQDKSGIDLSGMGGKGNQALPFEISQIAGKGTDQAYLKKGIAFLEEGLNLPNYKGKFVNLHDYVPEIIDGFTVVYRFMAENKEQLINQIQEFRGATVRTILRPTAIYGEFLRSLVHPDLLRDQLDRKIFLHRLWLKCLNTPIIERVLIDEMEDLLRYDVPLFTSIPGERHLRSSSGRTITDFFSRPAFDLVLDKIRNLSELDLYGQLQVLNMVMLASNADHYADVEKILPFENRGLTDKKDFLIHAIDIGDYLLKTKIEGINGVKKDITWISTVLEGNREVAWNISPVGLDFYNGNSGIALFLAYLAHFTGETRFKEAAAHAIVPILDDMKQYGENPSWSLGAYSGVGGCLFTVNLIAGLWNDISLYQQVEDALPGYIGMISQDTIFDYIGGATGALDILLCIYHHTGNVDALKGAILCGNHLIEHSQQMEYGGIGWPTMLNGLALTGYSHGNSGIAAAFSSLYRVTKNKTYLTYISQALEYERAFYDENEKNWRTPGREKTSYAWCHGAPGVLLSRLRLKENGYNDHLLDQEIKCSLETTLYKGFGNNRSYCHGDFGQLEILLYANKVLQDTDLGINIESVGSQLLEIIDEKMWNYGVSRGTDSKGLMCGLAGIGMGLLKQYDNDSVPNILALENRLLKRR
ncbi:type 2 lanthipeptide synthetase LanM family protein [Bacillus halotolerans]|uniref:type 2 lanthipeptide synthetase LanM family protein n=1 Tax=Bacillus halotolerans TaxID=260554 RepID=UPI002DB9F77A|nr:type 2 lanthipeptide synthetase LanM family protein [Bacillus halotolerans]MEC1543692.1 type 2 lanthipeptide synthetase LanM family protein [Bacillus halotolerans]